ncbi:gamma-glutamyl phosphate reductase [Parachlamydia acanthamoebae UV-7]|uniref:Gamma-glutamyl phosphate reductase n=2 Tax=Parachlamydia acanthamoebae TaxID=83552 RepID=F8KX74_PARAV|nr:glutamate-5-semialdehyde dehydrogenase [Parachlamydia acanthamoebae]KIA78729.1 Gamma-glutamyl phosphate reductase [Parachlamydia acanthamoebae]CCB85541.1 gamma-glutamyl phosphate reductase [Parachlamydia acanthamoebae UV-7]
MKDPAFIQKIGKASKEAAYQLATISTQQKNAALNTLADNLLKHQKTILEANQLDLDTALNASLQDAFLDRLSLKDRLEGIAHDVKQVAKLPDPVGEIFDSTVLANGLHLYKQRTPIGVIGVIYEARPNVTIDIASLTIKTGNSVILRGGSETLRTNLKLVEVIQNSLAEAAIPLNAVQFIDKTERHYIKDMLHAHEYIDLIIPRGGVGLHQYCKENSMIPVITGGMGICHLFVDSSADQSKALEVICNAKLQKPSACNALDTLLIHQDIAQEFIPAVLERLGKKGVVFPVSKETEMALKNLAFPACCHLAQDQDWDTEWLGLTLGLHVVKNLEEAIQHIQKHSQGHSDGILTENDKHAEEFIKKVDSACVYVNASTRFSDGAQFGLGAEVAISTQKIHARGPMALKELTSYKWIARGNYHTRKS